MLKPLQENWDSRYFFNSFIPILLNALLRNKRFALNEMFQRNVSKFAILYMYKKTRIVFVLFFISCNFTFSLMNALVYVECIKYRKFWSVSLEHFVERKPLISEECTSAEFWVLISRFYYNIEFIYFIFSSITNLKYWGGSETIISKTLQLLNDLSVGYGTVRKLVKLDEVGFLLSHHTAEHYPFLGKIKLSWFFNAF